MFNFIQVATRAHLTRVKIAVPVLSVTAPIAVPVHLGIMGTTVNTVSNSPLSSNQLCYMI